MLWVMGIISKYEVQSFRQYFLNMDLPPSRPLISVLPTKLLFCHVINPRVALKCSANRDDSGVLLFYKSPIYIYPPPPGAWTSPLLRRHALGQTNGIASQHVDVESGDCFGTGRENVPALFTQHQFSPRFSDCVAFFSLT